jgi:hypothetical protein
MDHATTPLELLDRLGLTPDEVGELTHALRSQIERQVESIVDRRDGGEQLFPTIDFADVASGTVRASELDAVAGAGCVVVRGTFEPGQAEAWDAELASYLSRNRFRERLLAKDPKTATGSRIWPVYWSRPQIEARQHASMVTVRRFLNSLWRHTSGGVQWFDPDHDIGYPDRVRRREPGAASKGLAAHIDSPSAGGWRLAENQDVFAPLLTGGLDAYDPWDAAHRTTEEVESPVNCTVFRTFQGWTALSQMHPEDGVLHVVPVPAAVGYRLVLGLAGELGVGSGEGQAAPRRDAGDSLVTQALVPIPQVEPGDTVWWHGDLYHAVGTATNETRWGNVMYIGCAPRCARNDAYVESMYARFLAGTSPVDFPFDDYEADFDGRATVADLDPTGRAQFGLS